MKRRLASLAAVTLLGLIPVICHAQDFSADVVYDSPKTADGPSSPVPEPVPSKLYVAKDKMRLEPQGFGNTIMLVDLEEHSATLLFPKEKAYQQLSTAPAQYFHVTDAEDACPDWQKVTNSQILCSKVGSEVVGGRTVIKYEAKGTSAGASSFVWIDPTLKFVVKWTDAEGGAELRNIKEGPQPSSSFAVPPGYEVLKPRKKPAQGPGAR